MGWWNKRVSPAPELTDNRIFSAFEPYLSAAEMATLRDVVVNGADLPLPSHLGACATLEKVTRAIVVPGFDTKTSFETRIATAVDPQSPAYHAGLRDGQQLFRWSIYNDDPSKDVELGVLVNGERRMIHYSPAKQISLLQYTSSGSTTTCRPF